jgi:predicted sulfurtransferase
MKKKLIGIAVMASFLLAVTAIGDIFAGKDKIIFDVPYGKVTFNHSVHKIECLKCHHDWKTSQTTGKLCKDCHKTKTEGKTISAKEAFHKTCKGCHDELKKAGKSTGPTGCTQCHKKK